MRHNSKGKRFLAFLLAAVLMLSVCPVTASAEDNNTGKCSHHLTHTDECGYTEGSSCTHDHGDGTCNYQAAVPAVDCDKNCEDTDGDGQIDHAEDCAYTPGTEEVKCDHDHNSECGYTEGHDCDFECEICQNVQKLINALPDDVTAENKEAVETQLAAIDDAKTEGNLTESDLAVLNTARYTAAVAALEGIKNTPATPSNNDGSDTTETGYEAYFFIRTDNKILNNPNVGYRPDEYIPVPTGKGNSGWTAIENALKEQKACSEPEDISANLLNQPTIDQIVSQLNDNYIAFNKERDLINWYVIKFVAKDGGKSNWHVDGSIVYRWWVKYDANGGNGPVPKDSLHENGTTVDVSFDSEPTRDGYTFLGWAKDKDATEPDYPAVNKEGSITMPKEDVTLYAVWKGNKFYTVSYEVSGTVPDGYTVPEGATVPEGSNYTVANVPESQKGTLEGKAGTFTFEGWTYGDTKVTELTNIQKDVVLQGIWTFTPDATDPDPSKPTETDPTDPDPTVPDPTDPEPTVPDPTDPEPDYGKLTIDKSANRTTVRPGKTITYTIKVTNKTGVDLEDITVSEKLDGNLTFNSASGDGSYSVKDGLWTISELKNGKTAKLTIKATVKSGVKDGTVIKNTVVITDVPDTPSDTVKVTVSNKISLIPQTGDTSSIGLWIGVMVACAVVLGVVLIFTVKKKKTR